ncbi:Hsp20/alpha crystallin family protein [Palaeococcus sp. (in: euryarchaeotes)]
MRRRRWDIWDPFDIMRELQEEIDEMFNEVFKGPRLWSYRREPFELREGEVWREPFVDIFDEGGEIVVTAELPGVDKKDIKIKIKDNVLYLEAQVRKERKLEKEGAVRVERYYSGYRRTIKLPVEVIPERAKARYKNGILEIKLPKKHPEKKEEEGFEIKIE